MKIAISVWGRFHAFYLASNMARRGALSQLMTSYPKFEVVKYAIPKETVTSFPELEVMARVWNRWPAPLKPHLNLQLFFFNQYDKRAAESLRPGSDLLVGWSGSCFKTLARAKELGMRTIVERGSSHIAFQTQILTEEYARFGMKFSDTHPGTVEKELAEYESADFISIASAFVRRTFIEQGVPERKLIQVPYGVDLSGFHPVPRKDKKFRVIYCGFLGLRKGIPYLLQAFSELKLPDAELWLVGNPLPEIHPVLAKYQSKNIVLKGHQPQSQLKDFYGECDVFCMPSIEDGFGMTQIQAAACGLPVIASLNTGGTDFLREGKEGFLVPIRNVEALKAKILWCYENREACKAMGEAAAARVGSGFTWDHYGERMYAEYERAMHSSQTSRAL